MDCKTGAEHLASLRDGRAVYIDGARVADVTTHPAFRNAVRSAAALYDFQALQPRVADLRALGRPSADQPLLAEAAKSSGAGAAPAGIGCLGRAVRRVCRAFAGPCGLEPVGSGDRHRGVPPSRRGAGQGAARLFRPCQPQRSVPQLCDHQSAGRSLEGLGASRTRSWWHLVDENSAGIARRLAETIGIAAMPAVREELGWIAAQAAMVEAMVCGMEAAGHAQDGYFVPNKHFIYAAQVLTRELYPRIVDKIRGLASGGANHAALLRPRLG